MTKWTRAKRLTTLGTALAVAMSMLAGPAAAAAPDPVTRTTIINQIKGFSTSNEDAAKKLAEAEKKLTESLNPKYWNVDELSKEGTKVFEKDRDAVKKLREAVKKLTEAGDPDDQAATVTVILDDLVLADETLVKDMITAAEAAGASRSKIADADKELDKAQEELDKGKPHDAIDHFKKAWEKAFKAHAEAIKDAAEAQAEAIKVDAAAAAAPALGSGGGDYTAYTFTFIDLNDPLPRQTFEASGTSQGNEGYLWVDTVQLQLHVSCSDAFTDGTGDKSDPTVGVHTLRVVSAIISKHKDGVVDKKCDIDGGLAESEIDGGLPEVGSIDLEKDFTTSWSTPTDWSTVNWFAGDSAVALEEVEPDHQVWYRFTITNTGNVELFDIGVTDLGYKDSVGACFDGLTLSVVDEPAECIIGPFSVSPDAVNRNVATVKATFSGGTVTDSDEAQFWGLLGG